MSTLVKCGWADLIGWCLQISESNSGRATSQHYIAVSKSEITTPPQADMATKRPAPHVHPSRQDQVPNEPSRKRQKPNYAGPKIKKAHPVNELKSEVRSLKRLLERNDRLPATVRQEKERALQTAQHELQEADEAKKRSEMIGKYHKIRFFDRQKATKRLKRVRKELQACESEGDERARLKRAVKVAEVDVNYAQYFPLDQPYVSLFPRKKEGEDEDGSGEQAESQRKGDDVMWQKVKGCMVNGTLDALRNGKLRKVESEDEDVSQRNSVEWKGKTSRKKGAPDRTHVGSERKSSKGLNHDDDGEESDGGFFE